VNPCVTIVPTTIETSVYTVGSARPLRDVPVIGWSGSYSTVQHLDTLRNTLAELARTRRFTLRVIGTPRFDLPGVEVEAIAWRAATEVVIASLPGNITSAASVRNLTKSTRPFIGAVCDSAVPDAPFARRPQPCTPSAR
jgi:hypothetical protein